MTQHGYIIHVRDANRNHVAQVDDFQSLSLDLKFNDVSSWEITLPADTTAAAYLSDPGAGIHIMHQDITIISGRAERIEKSSNASGKKLTISGPDDTSVLTWRLGLPEAPAETSATNAYDVRTGVASTIMRQYVDVNGGPSAIAQRQIAGLTLGADPVVGGTITGRARYEPLLDKMQELSLMASSELGFRVAQMGTDLEFQVFAPVDMAEYVRFSPELGNIASYDYAAGAPTGNYVYAGGSGEGVARVIRPGIDSASVVAWGRREVFKDARSTSSSTELDQAVDEELQKRAATVALSITPIDTALLSYPHQYGLGDAIMVIIDGVSIEQTVREVKITATPAKGFTIVPIVGSPSSPRERSYLASLLADMRARNRNLERR